MVQGPLTGQKGGGAIALLRPPRQSLLARPSGRARLRPRPLPTLKTNGLASEATPVEKAGYYRYRYGGY